MKIYSEINLKDFEFWSGALDKANRLSNIELEIIEDNLDALYPEGLSETEINDIFWFDFEMVAEWIGEDEDSILDREVGKCY